MFHGAVNERFLRRLRQRHTRIGGGARAPKGSPALHWGDRSSRSRRFCGIATGGTEGPMASLKALSGPVDWAAGNALPVVYCDSDERYNSTGRGQWRWMRQLPDAGFALFTQSLGPVVAAAGDALRDVGEEALDRLGECPLVPLPKENANPERDPGWRLCTTHKAATGRKPLVTSAPSKRH